MDDTQSASTDSAAARGRRAIEVLTRAGERIGYRAETEYPVQGGRLDVVWLTDLPDAVCAEALVVVAFEVEPSWRTRKHLKGDYLNLFDVGAALGVLVLLGDGADVESTRTFADVLVQRPGPRIIVWNDDHVDQLARSAEHDQPMTDLGAKDEPAPQTAGVDAARHVGKYRALWQWLAGRSEPELSLSFDEIEEVIGMPLPTSCRRYPAHWYSYDGSAVARAIYDAGWRASGVSLNDQHVALRRLAQPTPR